MMNATLRPSLPTLLTLALLATPTHAAESQDASFVQRGSWLESLLASRQAQLHEPRPPGPQPGEEAGSRVLSYAHDVQPILDAHCVECHSGDKLDGDLDLSGTMTPLFSRSYENLVPERRGGYGRRNIKYEDHPNFRPASTFGEAINTVSPVPEEER